MRVTFDTNALNDVISPETSQRGASGTANGIKVRAAVVEAGRVQGFFCETLVTLEGIQKRDRSDVFGQHAASHSDDFHGSKHHHDQHRRPAR
jgi:hypothetical protein